MDALGTQFCHTTLVLENWYENDAAIHSLRYLNPTSSSLHLISLLQIKRSKKRSKHCDIISNTLRRNGKRIALLTMQQIN